VDAGINVPFLDLQRIHEPLREEILADVSELLESGEFTNGPHVARFEQAYADYCGTAVCTGLGSGLDALRLALQALGVGPGDEVIVPAQTFVATYEAVTQVGATTVVVDVRDDDYNLDPVATEAAITPRTRCLLPVHLFGQLADMLALRAVADRHGLALLEDAAQAHGATRDGVGPAALSDAAAYSFYPGKNLGAIGDAGAVVSNDAELAAQIRLLREHGQLVKYRHEAVGWTARLDTIQAAVLLRKLPHLDVWTADRRRVADRYLDGLARIDDLQLPQVPGGSEPVWHLFVVVTSRPDELMAFLREREIHTGRHYPQPPHLTTAYEHLGHAPGSFPVAERIAAGCVSLPIFPGMTEDETDAVIAATRDFFG
jgi:dTDP-4-amino-4,6-dideoxygalactose transaminase